jgi:hypothetical protein
MVGWFTTSRKVQTILTCAGGVCGSIEYKLAVCAQEHEARNGPCGGAAVHKAGAQEQERPTVACMGSRDPQTVHALLASPSSAAHISTMSVIVPALCKAPLTLPIILFPSSRTKRKPP